MLRESYSTIVVIEKSRSRLPLPISRSKQAAVESGCAKANGGRRTRLSLAATTIL